MKKIYQVPVLYFIVNYWHQILKTKFKKKKKVYFYIKGNYLI